MALTNEPHAPIPIIPRPHSSRPSVLTFHTLALRETLSSLAPPEAFNSSNASPSAPTAEVG
eukprot:2545652-Pyramimonas_sp.AAC.1